MKNSGLFLNFTDNPGEISIIAILNGNYKYFWDIIGMDINKEFCKVMHVPTGCLHEKEIFRFVTDCPLPSVD